MKRSEIMEKARGYVTAGTRWKPHGRTLQHSDCGGMMIQISRTYEHSIIDYTGRVFPPERTELLKVLKNNWVVTSPAKLKIGQILLFHNLGSPLHMAIVGKKPEGLTIIHVSAARRKAVEEYLTPAIRKEVYLVFEFPGIEED